MVAPAKRPDGRATSEMKSVGTELNRKARWVLNYIKRNPRATYRFIADAVRDQFGGSIRNAERAVTRAYEIEREALERIDLSWIVGHYMNLYEEALRAKKFNAARACLDSLSRVTGNEKPLKIDIEHSGKLDVRAMAHVAILQLTPAQRANRERELEAKMNGAALPVIDVSPDPRDVALAGEHDDTEDDVAPSSNGKNGHGEE